MKAPKLWRPGDASHAVCPTCKALRNTTFRCRDVPLEASKTVAKDVLVAVCDACGSMASVPHQSAPRLYQARLEARKKLEARIPRHLQDALLVIALELRAEPKPFGGAVVRYYLRQALQHPRVARRVVRLARSADAQGRADARLSFAVNESWYDRFQATLPGEAVPDRSALVRGAIVALQQDYYERPSKGTIKVLEAIAEAAHV
jgi:hypothetical protein